MSKAPERIWAFAPDIFDNCSLWQDMPSPAGDTIEYVRADRIEELEAKLANARRDGFSAGISTAMGVLMDADTIAEAGAALAELRGQGTE